MSNESIPVIVFHKGYAPYLETCLAQAKKTNPDSRIILLGDDSNKRIDFVEHVNADAFPGFREFEPSYRHCSFLPVWLEKLWIQRWFVMRDFVRQEGLSRFLHIDTDVLLFCNVTSESSRFDGFDMTFARWDANRLLAHCLFVNRTEFLDDFCRYITGVYREDDDFQRLKTRNTNQKGNRTLPPWICDMSLLADYYDRFHPNAFWLEDCLKDGVCFDSRISEPGPFQPEFALIRKQKIKRIRFENGVPMAKLKDGTPVSMKIIHYHSFTKYLMPLHVQGIDAHRRFFWHTLFFEHKALKK